MGYHCHSFWVMTTVVRLDGVRKEYGGTTALDGVSLRIEAGDAGPRRGPRGGGGVRDRPGLGVGDGAEGALDRRSGEQVMDLLLDLNQIGQTLLLVTHDRALAERCATRIVRLADGRIA